jgi:hypothetical protein
MVSNKTVLKYLGSQLALRNKNSLLRPAGNRVRTKSRRTVQAMREL